MSEKPTPPRVTPADAIRCARRHWVKGRRIHLAELASELNIGRATLFRWVGSKDKLLGEALWTLYNELCQEAQARTPGQGIDYVVGVYRHINATLLHSQPLQRFIGQDPEYALRILTSSQSPLHSRTVDAFAGILQDQVDRGQLTPAMGIGSLAYFIVRLAESCLYSDIISGRPPRDEELEDACTAVRILLGGQTAAA